MTKKTTKKLSYNAAFRDNAVRLHIEAGFTKKAIQQTFCIRCDVFERWIENYPAANVDCLDFPADFQYTMQVEEREIQERVYRFPSFFVDEYLPGNKKEAHGTLSREALFKKSTPMKKRQLIEEFIPRFPPIADEEKTSPLQNKNSRLRIRLEATFASCMDAIREATPNQRRSLCFALEENFTAFFHALTQEIQDSENDEIRDELINRLKNISEAGCDALALVREQQPEVAEALGHNSRKWPFCVSSLESEPARVKSEIKSLDLARNLRATPESKGPDYDHDFTRIVRNLILYIQGFKALRFYDGREVHPKNFQHCDSDGRPVEFETIIPFPLDLADDIKKLVDFEILSHFIVKEKLPEKIIDESRRLRNLKATNGGTAKEAENEKAADKRLAVLQATRERLKRLEREKSWPHISIDHEKRRWKDTCWRVLEYFTGGKPERKEAIRLMGATVNERSGDQKNSSKVDQKKIKDAIRRRIETIAADRLITLGNLPPKG